MRSPMTRTPPSSTTRLAEQSPARGAGGPAVGPSRLIFLTAEALIRQGLALEPLVPLLRVKFPFQKQKIDDFTRACLVIETAHELARLGPHRLYDWTLDAAPGPIARRLQGKTKDAATIAEQLPALLQRERGETLRSLASLWPPHTVEAGRLAYLAGRMPKKLYASASSPLTGLIN